MPGKVSSLKQQAYDAILGQILRQEVLPGDLLNRRAVAADLGVSTAPVLEAMLQLDAEGFLETLPRKGTRVRIVRPEDIRGMLILREALECQAARLCCGEKVRCERPRLEKLAAAAEGALKLTPECQWQAELDLHRALMELTHCPALLQAFDKVMSRAFFFLLNQALASAGGTPTPRQSHLTLVEALCTDNPDAAEAAMRAHVQSGKTLALNLVMPS